MPLTHTRFFRVRYDECDAYGHVNNTHYLRYMQETAFDASAAAGYDANRLAGMGRLWLVRGTEIEYLQPLRYSDTVEVRTWVADFRRASSRRMYELRRAGDGELAARAFTDWVYVDAETHRAASIPDEISEAFFPEGIPGSFPARQPFPAAPPPPPGVFTMRRRVAWRDIDTARIVNNPVYMDYVEECGMEVIAAHGWPWQRMAEEGFAVLIRKHQIQYIEPARVDDDLEIATWASGVRRSTATRHYTIRRAGEGGGTLLVQVHSLGVWVDLETGKPIRIPAGFMADFEANIVPEKQIV